MKREELKQNNFYMWNNMIIKVAKIWTDRVAYSSPTQVCTVTIEYNPIDKGISNNHVYKTGDKVVIDEWKNELYMLKYNKYNYDLIAGVFE